MEIFNNGGILNFNIMASTYKITLTFQNPYIGQRNGGNATLSTGLTLRQAQKELLDLYNEKYEGERPHAPNWGLAVIQSQPYCFGARPTFSDGTRSFDWDSRSYSIEPEEMEEF